MQIYIHRNNEQLGPFTEVEVKAQLAAGTISPQDHVWWQGQEGWIPLSQSALMMAGMPTAPGAATIPATPGLPVAGGAVQPTSKLAIWALVCGCLGLFLSLLASIPAIVLGHLSLNEIKKNPGMQGRGMALAGLILGYVLTLLLPFISIVAISVLIALGNQVKGTFQTIQAQENAAAATNSPDQSATNSADQTTNASDQAPSTNSPDQSTNNVPAPVNSPDTTTNAPSSSTNSPASSTNASSSAPTAPPLSQ